MWMTDYVDKVNKALEATYGFRAYRGVLTLPDGVYPIEVDGRVDEILVVQDALHYCNFVVVNDCDDISLAPIEPPPTFVAFTSE